MVQAVISAARRWVRLTPITGPIFDKELCVSSRRRRSYVLRTVYVAILGLLVTLLWMEEFRYSGGQFVYQVSRMARVGRTTITFAVWFQFIATQIIAIVMLSSSISDEVYHRTLAALATTPITGLQIVMGKLLSKLLQLVLLMAVSLPLLAIVRVFGGVPWHYVVMSVAITLTTTLFVGSVALFVSIFSRRTYGAIITTVLVLGALFLLFPVMTVMIFERSIGGQRLVSLLTMVNPYMALGMETEAMMMPRMAGMAARLPVSYSTINCAITFACTCLLVVVSSVFVRRTALRQAAGLLGRTFIADAESDPSSTTAEKIAASIRRVRGSVVIWKEFRSPLLGRRRILRVVIGCLGLFILLVTYALCMDHKMLQYSEIQAVYVIVFFCLGLLIAIVLPSTLITTEKESGAWPLLLSTTLTDSQILMGKFAGAVRRCLPMWALLFGHLLLFSVGGFMHPLAIAQIAMVVIGPVLLLCCSGLYFSSRFNRTTVAVIMNFAFAATIWGAIPFLLFFVTAISRGSMDLAEACADFNPFVQIVVVIEACVRYVRQRHEWRYYWPTGSTGDIDLAMARLIASVVFNGIAAMVFLAAARARFRKRIV